MKKILSLLILLMALSTAFVPAHAESVLGDALEYLSAAGISLEYEEETIIPDQKVTRASFVQLVTKLLNMEDVKCDNVYYHDVSQDHWACSVIGVLTENGILTGNENKYFRPDDFITKDEASTILVSALGYRVEAESRGGFPEGFVRTASSLELFDNTSYSQELTLSDAIIIMRNALDVNLLKFIFQESDLGYTKSETVTVLSYYHNKYYAKGILEGCEGVSIKTTDRLSDDAVIIDGVQYKTKLTGLLNEIGTKIEFMYEMDDSGSEERVIVWTKSMGDSDIIDVQKDEYDYFNKNTFVFSYVPDGRDTIRDIDLSRGLVMIYNGAVAKGSYDSILNSDKYKVRFIKSHGSDEFNIAIVWKYENMVVGRVDLSQEVIYDKFNPNKILDISQIRERITLDDGQVLDQITEGDILSLYESEDGKLLRLKVSKNIREVTAKYVGKEDDQKVLFAEDGEYVLYDNNATFSVLYGESVRIYLDSTGYVVYIDNVKVKGFPVYLMDIKYSDIDEVLTVKTLDYDGQIIKRNTVRKPKVDGATKKLFEIYDIFCKDRVTQQQVLILELDEEGLIKSFDTVNLGAGESDNNSLTLVEANYNGFYKHHGAFFPKYIFASDAVMFYPPLLQADKGDDRNYLVKSGADLQNNDPYTADIYRYSKDTGYVNLVVLKSGRIGTSTDKNYLLVDEIKIAMNEDGELVEKLICYSRGNPVEYLTTTEFSLKNAGIIPGDIIGIVTNTSGKIKEAQRKYEHDGVYTTTSYLVPNNVPSFHKGYVHSKVGNILRIRYDGTDFESAFVIPEDMIVVYDDNEREKVRKGTIWDFTPGAKVVFQTNDETPILLVVYK